MDVSNITSLISSLRAQTAQNSITPDGLGSILQHIVNAISSIGNIDVEDEQALLTRLSAAEGNAETALTAAQSAQSAAANNVIDSFSMAQDDDKVTVTIKQHGHSAISFDIPAASSLLAGLLSATDKSHLDTAFAKRISTLAALSGDSVVTLKITFADSTEKTVTLTGASGGLGGSAGLMTKEQAEQLAALVSADGTAALKDASNHIKQELATPIILRNVTDTVFDDLAVGDIYYDTGHLFFYTEDSSINNDMGAPSKKVVYYCLADQMFYRWTGSRFVAAIHIESADIDIDVPTKVSDLENDLGFLTQHQSIKTINGETITGTGNVTIDGAASMKDASNHVKQSLATPVVLRNVTDTMFDDLNEGDIYYDSGHLFVSLNAGDEDLGAPSKKLIYYCLADSKCYRWTGSSFTAISITPHIDQTTGNWFIGSTNTGVRAQGPQGNTVVVGDEDEFLIVNNLTEGGERDALSAEMGKELANMITPVTDASGTDLDIDDENGNVLLRLSGGHVKTLNFDSRLMPSETFPVTPFVGSPKAFSEAVSTDGLSLWNMGNVDTVYNAYDALVTAYPDWFSREENIGKDATNTYDVRRYCLRYQHPSVNSARKDNGTEYWSDETFKLRHIYVQAGIHADEKWSVYGCYLAIKALLESDDEWAKFIKSNFVLDIVPLANPWGWVNNSSNNSNGKNLNRTYFTDKQAENNNIIGLIASLKGKGLVGIIDCHNTGSPSQYDLGYGYFVAKPAYKHWNYYGRITQQIAAVVRPMTTSVYPAAATGSHFHLWDATGNSGQLHEYADSQGLLGCTFEVAEAAGLQGCILTKAILINLINAFGTYIGQ